MKTWVALVWLMGGVLVIIGLVILFYGLLGEQVGEWLNQVAIYEDLYSGMY